MAVITYTCTVCKRSIDVTENKKGLSVVQRCIITDKCKGKLYKVGINQDYTRGKLPPSVEGLDDWSQRKALFNFTQTIKSQVWKVAHNLGTNPAIQIYVYDDSVSPPVLKEISLDTVTVTVISDNQVNITFAKPVYGQVQCIARSTSDATGIATSTSTTTSTTSTTTVAATAAATAIARQLTNTGELTIATIDSVFGPTDTLTIDLTFTTPANAEVTQSYTVNNTPSVLYSAWSDTSPLFLKNTKYTTRSFNVIDSAAFINNLIAEGSSVTNITVTNSTSSTTYSLTSLGQDDVIILLAYNPFTVNDKILNEYITFKNVPNYVFVSSSELYGYTSIIEPLFPVISILQNQTGLSFYTTGGTMSGLTGTCVLQNDGGDDLTLTADGAFTFNTALVENSPYYVTVKTQPTLQQCTITSGSGTLTADVTSVVATCANLYTVGGTMTGLTGTVVLQDNSGDDLTISADGSFTFSTALLDGAVYDVTVKTQPYHQECTITNGSGTIPTANVTGVTATCVNLYTIGGTISGLDGTVVLQDNGADNLSVSANGTFTFSTLLYDTDPYAVTVLSSSTGETCLVTNGTGNVAAADVTNVSIACGYLVGGSVTGLTGTVVLQDNGGDDLSISADGTFNFTTPVAPGNAYDVTVLTQPAGQTCTVTNGSGTISTADINVVTVTCVASGHASPTAPGSFSITGSSAPYNMSWTASTADVGYTVASYNLYISTDHVTITLFQTGFTGTSGTSNLQSGFNDYYLTAVDNTGQESGYSNRVSFFA